jgi:hypothetical protein
MVSVIATYAINAMNGKALVAGHHGQAGGRLGRKNKIHGNTDTKTICQVCHAHTSWLGMLDK